MKITESNDVHENNRGHVVISPERIVTDNKEIILQALTQLADAYKISIEDAAFALENALKRFYSNNNPKNNG